MSKKENNQNDKSFLVFVMTLFAGFPLVFYGLYAFKENLTSTLIIIISILLIAGLLFLLVILNREKILNKIFGTSKTTLDNIFYQFSKSIENYSQGQIKEGSKNVIDFSRTIFSTYAWTISRKWMIRVLSSLFLTFGVLIGSILLYRQNNLISDQTQKMKEQNRFFQRQVLSDDIAREYEIVYSDYNKYPISRKALATTILIDAIKERFSNIKDYKVDLSKAKLAGVTLKNIDLSNMVLKKVDFRGANLSGVNFTNSDLTGTDFSQLPSDTISGTNIKLTNLSQTFFNEANITNANFQYSIIVDSDLNNIKLSWLKENGELVSDPDFYDEPRNDVKLFFNSTLINIKNSPKDFFNNYFDWNCITDIASLTSKIDNLSGNNPYFKGDDYYKLKYYCEVLRKIQGFNPDEIEEEGTCWEIYHQ
ncbi:hypothetical protein DS884_11210 [Tenacibaculum sp. E3R01]|uniref:pentapeptide repeat-containing protein n=1 Tax=Tenacibaculum sp. E3R01 TaxID=2267227 RepID=UPI000DEA1EB5|nr:pentapeptide repeat-containing protein [Tenacibaculum sp. E3R01]RBW57147.1 hypothetical protein DS884_11210 [Tenacibaculum sp. E3R01]